MERDIRADLRTLVAAATLVTADVLLNAPDGAQDDMVSDLHRKAHQLANRSQKLRDAILKAGYGQPNGAASGDAK